MPTPCQRRRGVELERGRAVTAFAEAGPGLPIIGRTAWSADWGPWQALLRMRRDWPALVLTMRPSTIMADQGDDTLDDVPPHDALWDNWDSTPRVPNAPDLHLDGFDGALDVLLDLAERERIDLGRISVVDMVDQFLAAMARYEHYVALERRADWLVLAARLLHLRSRLLLPGTAEVATAARAEVATELGRLQTLQFVHAAAA